MELRLEHTEGLGRIAEVWLDGHLLRVCDGISSADERAAPGIVPDPHLAYVAIEGFSWSSAVGGNPGRKKGLEHVRDWSYTGYGQVVSIMPVVIDFGIVRMEDANWTTDESLVGRFVRIPIDRLEIIPSPETDWSRDAQCEAG